jgi:hypothetical protein
LIAHRFLPSRVFPHGFARFAITEWSSEAQTTSACSSAKKWGKVRYVDPDPDRGEAVKVRTTARLLSMLALALLLAGCDKCGGWFGMHAPTSLGVCKNTVPQQR